MSSTYFVLTVCVCTLYTQEMRDTQIYVGSVETAQAREVRTLRKKLRQVTMLQDALDNNIELNEDQMEKLRRRPFLVEELRLAEASLLASMQKETANRGQQKLEERIITKGPAPCDLSGSRHEHQASTLKDHVQEKPTANFHAVARSSTGDACTMQPMLHNLAGTDIDRGVAGAASSAGESVPLTSAAATLSHAQAEGEAMKVGHDRGPASDLENWRQGRKVPTPR